jgi:hypothetical protein
LRPVGGDADLAVPACAVAAIDYRLAVLRNYRVDALDGHALLCRLKIAVAMMALDGRTTIEEADWHLLQLRIGVQCVEETLLDGAGLPNM